MDLKENDALTDLPGMPLVRGVDALTAPGVRVVASFNQSNWPGIVSELAPGLVRAASDQHKAQLCNVWKKEHSYQSWPVLLGCPGVRATEYEPACANVGGVVAINCGSIDLSADPTLTGAVFDDRRWFRVTHSQGPPSVCAMKKTETLRGSIGVALSVYPTAIGHFVPEQLPNLLLLNAHLPPNVPILVGEDKVTRRYLTPLVDSGFVPADRFRYRSLAADGTVLQADTVYTVVNSHFSNVMNGDVGYRTARAAYSPNGAIPNARRDTILLVERQPGRARSLINARAVQGMLESMAAELSTKLAAPTATSAGVATALPSPLRVVPFRPNQANMSADIEAFRHAAVVVAPHGAGLANLIFAGEGTPVIEICYDDAR